MRRVEGTERGAGEWERISWDEALQEIADNIEDTQKQYGEGALAFLTASGNQAVAITSAYSRLASLLNASSIMPCLDMGSYYGMAAVAGNYISPLMGMGMWEGNEPTDAKNAKSIVVWGANITDAQIQNWHLVKEAMQGGTKLVVIDPTFTQIAAKADKWISVRPGSDTLLKYALMNIVLEKNAQDVDYLRDHTVARSSFVRIRACSCVGAIWGSNRPRQERRIQPPVKKSCTIRAWFSLPVSSRRPKRPLLPPK